MKKIVCSFFLVMGIVFGIFCQSPGSQSGSGPMDLVVLLDTSASMSNSYRETGDYLTGPFLREFLRIGDTFHLISFASVPKLELSRRIEGAGDVEAVIGRLLLMYPLDPLTDVSGAFDFAERYASSLPESRLRKLVLVTDGDIPNTQTLVNDLSARLKNRGTELQYIKVPVTGGGPSSGRPQASGPAQTVQTVPPRQGPVQQGTPSVQPAPAGPNQPASQAQASGLSQTAPSSRVQSATAQQSQPSPQGSSVQQPADQPSPAGTASQGVFSPSPATAPSGTTDPATIPAPGASQPASPAQASREESRFSEAIPPASAAGPGQSQTVPAAPAQSGIAAQQPQSSPQVPAGQQSANQASPPVSQSASRAASQPSSPSASQPTSGSSFFSGGIPLLLIIGLIILALLILGLVIFFAARNLHRSPNRVMARTAAPDNHHRVEAMRQDNIKGAEMMGNYAAARRNQRKPLAKDKEYVPAQEENGGPLMLNLFVEDQNTAIGRRNIHVVKGGYTFSVGGGRSDFLIFLVPIPPHIADVTFDGRNCTFIPRNPRYFPDIGSQQVPNCIGKTIRVVSDKNYELQIRIERYEDPLKALNKMLNSISVPGKAK